jgi:hypothetical protein
MLPTYAGPLRDPGAQLLRVAPSASPLDARQFSTKICKLSVHRRERNRARVRCQDGSGRNLTVELSTLGVTVPAVHANVADLGYGVDGVLGMNFLLDYNIEIRPGERRILVERIAP